MKTHTGAAHCWDENAYCVWCKKDGWDLTEAEMKTPNCPGKPHKPLEKKELKQSH